MRRTILPLIMTAVCLSLSEPTHSAEPEKLPLGVLYLSREGDEKRTAEFVEFLSARFARCVAAPRNDFRKELLAGTDVVLIDWSQQERVSAKYDSPVGPLEDWDTPTVLLGSAGLVIAGPWQIIGGAG